MTKRLAVAACVIASAVTCAWPARADLVAEVSPSAGAGASDDIYVVGSGQENRIRDGFTLVGGAARLRYVGVRASHTLAYNVMYLRYVQGLWPDALSNNLTWLSTFNLSALLTLRLGAGATLTRSTGIDAANPLQANPESTLAGSALFMLATANESLTYEPSPRWHFVQTLATSYLRYLDSTMPGTTLAALPRTTFTTLALEGERRTGREGYGVEADVTDTYTSIAGMSVDNSRYLGHTVLARLLAGWRHEFSPFWWTRLQAGPSVIYRLDGAGVAAPAGVVTVNYTQIPWFATLVATQTPTANPYLGDAILADAVTLRLAMPVSRSERIFVGAFGGYNYARIANADGNFERAYDQFIGGASINVAFPRGPASASLSYTVTSQRGNTLPGYSTADLGRQYVFLNFRSDLAWGPGTPPLFGGAM